MKINQLIIALVACACTLSQASAQEQMTYAYATKQAQVTPVGTLRTDTYDIAIALTNPSISGMTVTNIEIPVQPSASVSDLSIWISKELKLQSQGATKVNVPDLSFDLEMPTAGADVEWISLRLPEPYTIPKGGIYVGYSFKVNTVNEDNATKKPIVATEGSEAGSFFLHTTRTYKSWEDRSESLNAISMIQVTLEGNTMPDNAAKLGALPFKYVAMNADNSIAAMVYNIGTKDISSIEYTTTAGEKSFSETIALDSPIPATFGYGEEVEFTLPTFTTAGECAISLTINAVNGTPLSDVSVNGKVSVATFVPKHLAVVEEYTGMWCGNCPRGFVAMEKMNEWYPDFIGIAYHNNDKLAMESGDPGMTVSFPSAFIDRSIECDPYNADLTYDTFSLPMVWERFCAEFAPAAVDVVAEWDEESQSVTATSKVNWAVMPDDAASADYRMEYVLMADDLYDSSWKQANYYANGAMGHPEYMDEFTNGPKVITGLHFNDVAMMTSGFKGVAGSIPSINIGETTIHTFRFDTKEAFTAAGEPFPFHKDKLRIVAMVIKGGGAGKIVNAAKCDVKVEGNGIDDILADDTNLSGTTVYFDLNGRRLPTPQGLCIARTTLPDGSVRHKKLLGKSFTNTK